MVQSRGLIDPGGVAARASCLLALLGLSAPVWAGTVTGTISGSKWPLSTASTARDWEVTAHSSCASRLTLQRSATVIMKGKAFSPHVAVVAVGGTVEFPNEDPIFHNAFSVSGDNAFDLQLYKRPKMGAFTFQHPGIVKVYCNIHPQMSAVVLVRDNPLFTKAAADGSFAIEGVPAGKYTVKAWQERAGEAAVEVTVPDKGEAQARFALDASSYKTVPHKNKFGKDYTTDDKY